MNRTDPSQTTINERFSQSRSSHRFDHHQSNSGRLLLSSYQQRKRLDRIQETNLSDCSLLEQSFQERIEQSLHQKCDPLSSHTEENLHKLQQITDDVKSLTRQLQLSIELNRNDNAQSRQLDRRLLGEICYQLERRILTLIFSQSKHLYGYSLRLLPFLIENESNVNDRRRYQRRWNQIEKYLNQCHFHFASHSLLTFNTINEYGIYPDYTWLSTHADLRSNLTELKTLCYSMLRKSEEKKDFSILIDSLQLISKSDGHPLFYW